MKLRKFNNFLSIVVIALGIYIAIAPFWPQIQFYFRDKSASSNAPYKGELAGLTGSDSDSSIPSDNRIVIPSIQVNEPVYEGDNIWVIHNGGTWRRPKSSTPDKPGNTVIIGHRFYGNNISTFYHLDKVEIGQKLAVYWQGKEYVYEVTEKKIVAPTQVDVEAPTDDTRLTIYTCTPIWTATDRLVVVAKPVKLNEEKTNANQ